MFHFAILIDIPWPGDSKIWIYLGLFTSMLKIIIKLIIRIITDTHLPKMGVSENSVPLNPMVLLIIIPMKNGYFIGNINPTFSDKPK